MSIIPMYNMLATVAYDTTNVVSVWNMFENPTYNNGSDRQFYIMEIVYNFFNDTSSARYKNRMQQW